jgi:hypothetical protein
MPALPFFVYFYSRSKKQSYQIRAIAIQDDALTARLRGIFIKAIHGNRYQYIFIPSAKIIFDFTETHLEVQEKNSD